MPMKNPKFFKENIGDFIPLFSEYRNAGIEMHLLHFLQLSFRGRERESFGEEEAALL